MKVKTEVKTNQTEPQSKRKSTRLNEGIKKKVAAHNRKERKKQKKDITWKSRLPKDPGIPNSFPFKAELLAKQEEERQKLQQEKELKRQQQREAARAAGHSEEQIEEELEIQDRQDNSNRLAALMESAQAAIDEYEGGDDDDEMDEDEDEDEIDGEEIQIFSGNVDKESSRKAFDKIYKQVVENSDVILYVLDARNPEGTRSRQVEHTVLSNPEKRLVYVLNKIDLVPNDVLRQWKDHLELSFPTIPLAASSCASNAQTFKHPGFNQATTSHALFQSLKQYASQFHKKGSISVGIIGYPNVGKSSVINALTTRHGGNRQSCPVGATAGVTTSIRKVKVDNKLNIWDSPGIVFPSEASSKKRNPIEEQARLVLLNALPPKHVDDHRPAVSLLLKRLQKNPDLWQRLHNTYDVPPMVTEPHDEFVTAFLVHMSRRTGRLKKGGVPDLSSAATAVISDWRDGRLCGWALPVKKKAQSSKDSGKNDEPVVKDQVELVDGWKKEFSIEGLWDQDEESMDVE